MPMYIDKYVAVTGHQALLRASRAFRLRRLGWDESFGLQVEMITSKAQTWLTITAM